MKSTLPYVLPLPWREALPLFPEKYRALLLLQGERYFDDQTLVFPCKSDIAHSGKEWVQFLSLREDREEPDRWSLSYNDFFFGGGADGDAECFGSHVDAVKAANEAIRACGFNLDANAWGDKATTDERFSIPAAVRSARESMRVAELDIRRALSLSITGGNGVSGAALSQLLEDLVGPVCDAGRKLHRLTMFEDEETEPKDMQSYRQTLDRLAAKIGPMPSRIPPLVGRDVAGWARALKKQGLAYHIDDDPADIYRGNGPLFTPIELKEVRSIVATFTKEEREIYFGTLVGSIQEHRAPVEQPEPPPFNPLRSHCEFVREGDGKRCNRILDAGVTEHEHSFTCGKPCGYQDRESCDLDDGHTGPCESIPF